MTVNGEFDFTLSEITDPACPAPECMFTISVIHNSLNIRELSEYVDVLTVSDLRELADQLEKICS